MKKPGRNDPCPCGSGKKFKKCCESKMLGGRFKAEAVGSQSAPIVQKATGLTSLFQMSTLAIPKKTSSEDPVPSFKRESKEGAPKSLNAQS